MLLAMCVCSGRSAEARLVPVVTRPLASTVTFGYVPGEAPEGGKETIPESTARPLQHPPGQSPCSRIRHPDRKTSRRSVRARSRRRRPRRGDSGRSTPCRGCPSHLLSAISPRPCSACELGRFLPSRRIQTGRRPGTSCCRSRAGRRRRGLNWGSPSRTSSSSTRPKLIAWNSRNRRCLGAERSETYIMIALTPPRASRCAAETPRRRHGPAAPSAERAQNPHAARVP